MTFHLIISALAMLGLCLMPHIASACTARKFIDERLPQEVSGLPAWTVALLHAYPELRLGYDGASFVVPNGKKVELEGPTNRTARQLFQNTTVGDQFAYTYPVGRDLTGRLTPYADPGRHRNESFLQALYGETSKIVEASLVSVSASPLGPSSFRVTRRSGVVCQLQAALDDLTAYESELRPYFTKVGGGFNWRQISGTHRMSPHAYGIAIDINPQLGKYWKWTGATEGQVGGYDNEVPWVLVETMEQYGFIWGGKWHHFDGMHFEYRPELIVYSRLQQGRN